MKKLGSLPSACFAGFAGNDNDGEKGETLPSARIAGLAGNDNKGEIGSPSAYNRSMPLESSFS
jgi:hypothetical protein